MEEVLELVWKSYGLVGVLILLPVAACVFLWRHNLTLHREITAQANAALEGQRERMQDQTKRIGDYERMMETLVQLVKEQSALNTETNGALSRISDTVERLERHVLSGGRG